MLTIVGNNFGGNYSGVQLKSVETRFYVVVDGIITVIPSNATYKGADVLELEVQGLQMVSSVPSAIYLTCQVNGQRYVTIAKAWIKNSHTICIEKVGGWASLVSYQIHLKCMFFPTGYDFCPKGVHRDMVYLDNAPSGVKMRLENCLFQEGWMSFYLQFSQWQVADPSALLQLTLSNVPEGAMGSLLLVYNEISLNAMGSGYVPMTLNGSSLVSEEAPGDLFNSAEDYKFIKGIVIYD